MDKCFYILLAAVCCTAAAATDECAASDARLTSLKESVCSSLVGPTTPWCTFPSNVTAAHDWPSQAVYMNAFVSALAAPDTCLNTTIARDLVTQWLNTSQADPTVAGAFMNVWQVFQVQYYDMPRKPGDRIESPDTLGRKCWAFAYLDEKMNLTEVHHALAEAGLDAHAFEDAYNVAVPETLQLCNEVIANCFVNATYNPQIRNGTCPGSVALFALGFEAENLPRGGTVGYPFYG
jgi:hypothetical protein